MTTDTKTDPYVLTDDEQARIKNAAEAAGLAFKVSNGKRWAYVIDHAGLSVVTFKCDMRRSSGRYYSRDRVFIAEGRYIPMSGNQRWGQGKTWAKDLCALLDKVRPYMRTEKPSEAAQEATTRATARWNIGPYSFDRAFNPNDPHAVLLIRLNEAGVLSHFAECAAEAQDAAVRHQNSVIEAAAKVATLEMWQDFDRMLKQREEA